VTSGVITGLGTDFPTGWTGIAEPTMFPSQTSLPRYSYGAAGAITPNGGIHFLNGTSALAMTLAVPTTLQDGEELIIIGNGKAAHTVTFATAMGDGGANLDVATFAAGGQLCMRLFAANGIWVWGGGAVLAGTQTNNTVTFA